MPDRANAQSGAVPVTPEMYQRVFETHHEGALVLEDLMKRFGGNPYTKGGLEGDRHTCFKAGQNDVVNYVANQINRAHGADTEEAPE